MEAIPQPFKYVGQFGVMAEPSGFYYMRARYYDPKVGRFVSEDPLGFGGGDVNLSNYVGNNPISYVDANGENATEPVAAWITWDVATPEPTDAAWVKWAAYGTALAGAYIIDLTFKDGLPTGSKPISDTPWSGDHTDIKRGVGARPNDDTYIDPDGNVWTQPDGNTWTNHGPAGTFTPSGKPNGQRGKDRGKRCQ